jgi:signal transduction histidine kinase
MHPILSEEVYRIACEGIRNAFLHSEGSRINVEIRYAKDFILLVNDDGRGIARDVAERGLGDHVKSGHTWSGQNRP